MTFGSWIILYGGGCPVYRGILSSTCDLDPLGASSTLPPHPKLWQPKISPDTATCPPLENHGSKLHNYPGKNCYRLRLGCIPCEQCHLLPFQPTQNHCYWPTCWQLATVSRRGLPTEISRLFCGITLWCCYPRKGKAEYCKKLLTHLWA